MIVRLQARTLMFCILAVTNSALGQSPPDLFKAIRGFGQINPTDLSGGIEVRRYRIVQTDSSLINQGAASTVRRDHPRAFGSSANDRPTLKVLTLNLFEDFSIVADFKSVSTSTDERTITWNGIIRGSEQSSVTISITGRTVVGNVSTTAGQIYEIRPVGSEDSATQAILQLDAKSFPPESRPIPIKGAGTAQDINPNAAPATLNVLVAYTAASAKSVGGPAGMAGLISIAENETNQGYQNSGVSQRIRIVGSVPVVYDDSAAYSTTLDRLADPHDGYLDEIHPARANVHADMVVLLVKNQQSCGLSYLASPPTAQFASKAFSVVNVACATGLFSFGHELGHLQGCNHDRVDADSPGAFSYSYGYQQVSKDPRFRDIMSYDCAAASCPRINYWSNPSISYKGIPIGETSGQNPTNNALTLNRTQYVASGWRQ